MRRRCALFLLWWMWAVPVAAQTPNLTFTAAVDKSTVLFGEPITLTLTLSGAVSGAQVAPVTVPEGFLVAARRQSTNFSFQAGVAERSTALIYVLIPQRIGTFQLGPFRLTRRHQDVETAPIEITVKKPVLPPGSRPQGERFFL